MRGTWRRYRVAVLATGETPPGVRDLAVPRLPAGVYLVREAGVAPLVEARRLTVVR